MLRNHPYVTWAIWTILIADTVFALATQRWTVVFVSVSALVLTILPALFVSRFSIRLPMSFLAAISIFVFCTLFLGEVYDFYERYWWWDILLHGMSAVAFGLIGFLFVFYMFEGDRYAAPPIAVAFTAFCFAVTIGTLWEIFEFAMDQAFGLNMQKSGLVDTMGDLIVDMIGATIGAASGFLFLKGRERGGLNGLIAEFVHLNRDAYKRFRQRRRERRANRR
jgi:hypothetical protein